LTDGNADDAKAALDLIDSIEADIESLTADAAYDAAAIACNILNRMAGLGAPESIAIGA
jgi:hypothetical protein